VCSPTGTIAERANSTNTPMFLPSHVELGSAVLDIFPLMSEPNDVLEGCCELA
jgi:hypothetical protein